MTKYKKFKYIGVSIVGIVTILILLYIILTTILGTPIRVHGDSMLPTIKDGSTVLYKDNYDDIEYNDIIVFKQDDKVYIKRVIGKANDKISVNNGFMYRNDELLDLNYHTDEEQSFYSMNSIVFVPISNYYVIGDNYYNSIDSRTFGTIEEKDILGVVSYVL